MSVHHIIQLLGFCLNDAYFLFHGQFYEKKQGAPMRFPVSPIFANLVMETFESKALGLQRTHPDCGKDVDHTFVIQQTEHKENFLQQINFIDQPLIHSWIHATRCVNAFSRYHHHIRTKQNFVHRSIKKIHIYKSISTVGQSSSYSYQMQCD